jgi:hypothetical protein
MSLKTDFEESFYGELLEMLLATDGVTTMVTINFVIKHRYRTVYNIIINTSIQID